MKLINKTMSITAVCVTVLMLTAAPLFYELTEEYYTDRIEDVIKDIKKGKPLPKEMDLKHEILEGVAIQFGITIGIFAIGVLISTLLVSKRLWRPFEATIKEIDHFRLEKQKLPALPKTDIIEFGQLNSSITELMANSIASYKVQKEFIENASHELQTPISVIRSKLDILIQQPGLTGQQAKMIEDMYDVTARMSQLSRNLLLLSKIENNQYRHTAVIELPSTITRLISNLEPIFGEMAYNVDIDTAITKIKANPTLFDIIVNNLVVNAIRHNTPTGTINISLRGQSLTVSNAAQSGALDKQKLFVRFYKHDGEKTTGNGLGLSIVKTICDYYGWKLDYDFNDGRHTFTVNFS